MIILKAQLLRDHNCFMHCTYYISCYARVKYDIHTGIICGVHLSESNVGMLSSWFSNTSRFYIILTLIIIWAIQIPGPQMLFRIEYANRTFEESLHKYQGTFFLNYIIFVHIESFQTSYVGSYIN